MEGNGVGMEGVGVVMKTNSYAMGRYGVGLELNNVGIGGIECRRSGRESLRYYGQ
jgi:hypothetical protein